MSAFSMCRRSGSCRDRHRLNIYELANSLGPELAAEAGALCAPERKARIGRDHAVDENHPGFQFAGEKIFLRRVVGPGRRPKPERTVIRDPKCFLCVSRPETTGNGPEDFFTISGRIARNIGEHRWLIKEPR